jgi:hypothetical protein
MLETPLMPQVLQVGDVLLPADRSFSCYRRSPTAALIVVDELSLSCQLVKTGQEVIMVRSRTAVQNHRGRSPADPALEDADSAHCADMGPRLSQPSSPHPEFPGIAGGRLFAILRAHPEQREGTGSARGYSTGPVVRFEDDGEGV